MPGHPELKTPVKKSELQRVTEVMRAHHNSMREQDKVIATELRRGLVAVLGRTGAYRVGRQFSIAASQNAEAARTYVRAYNLYVDLYEKKRKAQTKFDPNS